MTAEEPVPQQVEILKDAVRDTYNRLRSQMFTFVSASLYLCIAVLSTTQQDLLFGRLLRLPIFDVDLPIDWFYVLMPLVYVALHLALLRQVDQLAQQIAELAGFLNEVPNVSDKMKSIILWTSAPYGLLARSAIYGARASLRTALLILIVATCQRTDPSPE